MQEYVTETTYYSGGSDMLLDGIGNLETAPSGGTDFERGLVNFQLLHLPW